MYSYPNFVPLDSGSIQRIVDTLDPYPFDRIHGAFPQRTVQSNAKEILKRSAERFIRATTVRS